MGIFHRYQSTIHGNYRQAYLRGGLLTGALLVLYLLARLLMGAPVQSPVSYISDAVMLVLVVLFTAYYRNSLPEGKITLKEAMLFGMGTAVVGAAVYGISLWIVGLIFPQQAVIFTGTMAGVEIPQTDSQIQYWAALWGIVGGVSLMIVGAFGAFLASIFFRNEKSEIKHKKS